MPVSHEALIPEAHSGPFATPLNSASPDDSETLGCAEDQVLMVCVPSRTHPPLVLFLVPAQSVSE